MKIIVIKVGSSILMTHRNKLDEFRIAHIADQILRLQLAGFGVILVVSGAVASGFNFVKFGQNDENMKVAAAGIGQAILISTFQQIFVQKKLQVAQVLLTQENLEYQANKDKLKDLLLFYLSSGFIPVVNENDVISLNSFGGNDLLGSEVASLVNAEELLILSTFDQSFFGVGGGESKKKALEILEARKIKARIVDGKHKNIILEVAI